VWGIISNYWFITFLHEKHFYVKSGWSCSMKWGFPGIFFLTKTKLNQTGLLSLFWWKTFFTWNQVNPALWNRVFPEFFFLKNKTKPKRLVITVWDENKILMEIYYQNFFRKKS
jgi:hypothetical protein